MHLFVHTSPIFILPFIGVLENSPDSHMRVLKPPPQVLMLLGWEAKLTTYSGCSEHQTLTVKG